MALSAGTRLGPYEIVSALGSGGMGEVYRARDPRLRRDVAIKVLPVELANDAERLSRFEEESRSASALNHPNIVTIYDVGQQGAVSYIAMELVEGQSVRELLARGPLPLRRILAIGTQIAEGLARAHSARIVHRDLKPENVMVTGDGLVKILDFGLAKLSPHSEEDGSTDSTVETAARATSPGVVLGTAGYMSPEQAVGRAVDFRSDQFSLGAILYELVTGVRPFQRATTVETLSAILKDEPAPLATAAPQAPEGLGWIVERCLSKEPDERYASTRDLARDLANLRDRAPEAAAAAPASAKAPPSARARNGARLVTIAAAVLAVAAGAFLALRPRTPAAPAPEEQRSLAILPFQNLGGRAEDQYFADGITESLITDVAKARNLLVIARNSVFQYRGRAVDVRDVGRELKVRYVLEGSVQRAGDFVRINAQLIDAVSGYHLWADKYDRPLADIFALQDDISRRIAQSLEVTLAPTGLSSQRPPTRSFEAYDAFLRGKEHSHRSLEAEDVDAAISMFERTVSLDPQFARAHAELATAYTAKFFNFDPRPVWEQRGRAHVQKALSLDPALPEAYVARGNLTWTLANGFPHENAIRDFRRALEINPNLADAHRYLGRVYYHVGLFEQALAEWNQALRVDPKDVWVIYRMGALYSSAQQHEKALGLFDAYLDTAAVPERALVLAYLGREDEALAAAESGLESLPGNEDFLAIKGLLLARRGDRPGAERAIAGSIASGRGKGHFHHNEYWYGCAYAVMGKKKEAISWLERAARDGFPCYPLFQKDPYLAPLRREPEFQALLLRMRKQWERYRATL